MSWSGGTDNLDPGVRDAYHAVTWLERKASGWLILRFLNRNPRRDNELRRYGPRGAVDLARMRAMQGWLVILFVPAVAVSIAFGFPTLIWVFLVLVLLAVVGLRAALRAAREGRRWRSQHGID